jgi:hypothetical protein
MRRRHRDDEEPGTTGYGYGPGGEAYDERSRSRDWAPYRDQPDWPRRQHVAARAEGPGQREYDSDMRGSYGEGGIPRWSSEGEQSFRGRGPRGYRRSDERIREDVCDRLTEDHDIDASDIDVKVESGEVTLEGTVDARRSKWLAEELASRCSGVVDVHNHLRVRRPAMEQRESESASAPRNGGGRGQTQTAQTGLGAQNRTDR